jgi:hypothetical protein
MAEHRPVFPRVGVAKSPYVRGAESLVAAFGLKPFTSEQLRCVSRKKTRRFNEINTAWAIAVISLPLKMSVAERSAVVRTDLIAFDLDLPLQVINSPA